MRSAAGSQWAGVRGQGAPRRRTQYATRNTPGVHLLYISPLKALNNDIERNLRAPLAGIRETATETGIALPPLRVAVRTGDTPGSARMAMVKQPPQIAEQTGGRLDAVASARLTPVNHSPREPAQDPNPCEPTCSPLVGAPAAFAWVLGRTILTSLLARRQPTLRIPGSFDLLLTLVKH